MKNTMFAKIIFFALIAVKSYGAVDWDGCYQLYMPGSMFPAVCLEGTKEEGINGAGVRLVIFGTNTDRIAACGVSSSLGGSANSLEFIVGSTKQMVLSNVRSVGLGLEGDANFGKTNLKFMKIDSKTATRLLTKFHSEPKCRGLSTGTLVTMK